ncbi:hypothetical protein PMNALOAF_1804 [Methylobacterium adhaesivum]|jgi:hypothetical protein|uniref:DUF2735 domain-containing protein n=1 Tax=Methylobacterium adhaesivum TaxID=333297 RepID=A0ABT8BCK9_9HYPH|nr:DUF2735 domain-containing protein [Methylobacterium adhaesivum]MDN3589540.1 DUF2735 domain-containing protein [Methylobacterium adhaesivum]GJD30557.1 hypothetical protein PMNALOAF_1804 [Methylobacterium adhaesivum]
MMSSVTRETAKIYAFPVGGRLGADRREAGRRTHETKATPAGPVVPALCGYHEAALMDADRSRKS